MNLPISPLVQFGLMDWHSSFPLGYSLVWFILGLNRFSDQKKKLYQQVSRATSRKQALASLLTIIMSWQARRPTPMKEMVIQAA